MVQTHRWVYDELSRMRQSITARNNTTNYSYDTEDNQVGSLDPISRTTAQIHDSLNRLQRHTDEAGQHTQMSLDDRDNLTSLTDPKGNATTYLYDGFNQLIRQTSPDTGATVYHYDAEGNLTRIVDARNVTTNFTYDALNRRLTMSFVGGTGASTLGATWAYDDAATEGIGRLRSITESGQSLTNTFWYDDRGNLIQHRKNISSRNYDLFYRYNLADRLISVTYPSGRIIDYTRDATGRINTIRATVAAVTSDVISSVEYRAMGPWRALTYGNGLTLQRGFDLEGLHTARLLSTSAAFVDDDADLMDDLWEQSYGFKPNDPTDALEDADGDGTNNRDEFLNGNDPLYNPAGYAAAVTAKNPVAYWRLDDTTATLTAAVGGLNGNYTGTHSQGQSSLAQTGTSVQFSGGQAQVPHNAALNAAGDFTVEFFLRFTGNSVCPIYTKADTVSPTAGPSIRALGVNNGQPATIIEFNVDGSQKINSNAKGLNDNRWRHYALIRRGNQLEIWINGRLDATQTLTTIRAFTTTNPLDVMKSSTYATTGALDELAFYNHALRPTEIAAHFQSQALDKDSDAMPNVWELDHDFDPLVAADATEDVDGDGLTNFDEYTAATDPLINPAGYSASITADAPTAFYHLDDASGATAIDSGVNALHGAYTSATSTTSAFATGGNAAGFAGGNVTVPHNALLNPPAEYTIEFWGRWSGTIRGALYSKLVDQNSTADVGPLVASNSSSNGQSAGRIEFREAFYKRVTSDKTGLNDNQWRHYAFVKRAGKLEIWINGLLDKSTTTSATTFTTTNPLKMMADGTLTVAGAIDEVAYYRSALSPLDIKQHYLQALFVPLSLRAPIAPEAIPDALAAETVVNASTPSLVAEGAHSVESGSRPIPWLLVDRRSELTRAWLMDASARTQETNAFGSRHPDDTTSSDANAPQFEQMVIAPTEITDLAQIDLSSLQRVVVMTNDGADLFTRDASVRGEFHHQHVGRSDPALMPIGPAPGLNQVWSYVFDTVNRLTQINKPAGNETFNYDVLDRLLNHARPSVSGSYTYDANSNRLSRTDNGVTTALTYSTTSNRMLSRAGQAVTHTNAGNRATDQVAGGTRTFTYNSRNRLMSVRIGTPTVGTYTHDALNQRVRKVAGGSTIVFVHDLGGRLIGEYTTAGVMIREYVYLDDEPVALFPSTGGTFYLHPDHLGSPREATDSQQRIVWSWSGDPFGDSLPNQDVDGDGSTLTVPLRFAGQYYDTESNLSFNWHRYYEPSTGRYIESDPIGTRGGMNIFRYAFSQPLTFTDPNGLEVVGPWTFPPGPERDAYERRYDGEDHVSYEVGGCLLTACLDYNTDDDEARIGLPFPPELGGNGSICFGPPPPEEISCPNPFRQGEFYPGSGDVDYNLGLGRFLGVTLKQNGSTCVNIGLGVGAPASVNVDAGPIDSVR